MKFILAYWQIFIVEQRVKIIVLTAYHPQIDGQIEKLN